MSIDESIGRYLHAAAEHWTAQLDLGSQSPLRRGNNAADELRRLATEIGSCGPEAIRSFSRLLDEPRNGVRGWVAFHLLEVMNAPPDVVDRAFEVLSAIAKGDGLTALGTRMRLQERRIQFGRSADE